MPVKVELDDDLVEYVHKQGRFGESYSDVFRRKLPDFKNSTARETEANGEVEDERSRSSYPPIWGYSVTTLVRALGAEGWTIEQVDESLRKMGVSIKPATLKTQIYWGENWAKGNPRCRDPKKTYGAEPPKLTPEQLTLLREGKVRVDSDST